MRTSDNFKELSEALAKVQSEVQHPKKNRSVNYGNTKFEYADITACLDAVRPALSKHGISLMQGSFIVEGAIVLTTRLSKGDQWVEVEYPLCSASAKHQDIGSAMTYGRRYSLMGLLGIASDDDIDAKGDVQAGGGANTKKAAPKKENGAAKAWFEDTAAPALRALGSLEGLETWKDNNKATIDKLEKADLETFKAYQKLLAEREAYLETGGIAAE